MKVCTCMSRSPDSVVCLVHWMVQAELLAGHIDDSGGDSYSRRHCKASLEVVTLDQELWCAVAVSLKSRAFQNQVLSVMSL